jgi:hypothetical protein
MKYPKEGNHFRFFVVDEMIVLKSMLNKHVLCLLMSFDSLVQVEDQRIVYVNTTMPLLITQKAGNLLIQRFRDLVLSPSSCKSYSVGPNQQS